MRPAHERHWVRWLLDAGLNNCQIVRATGIPLSTVAAGESNRCVPKSGQPSSIEQECPRCGDVSLHGDAYAHLLGLYLGDGWIHQYRRGVFGLWIFCADRYPGIIREAGQAIAAMRPSQDVRVLEMQREDCKQVGSYWKHWPCLFPQHGPGRKYERTIELEPWQAELVAERRGVSFAAWSIRTDGEA